MEEVSSHFSEKAARDYKLVKKAIKGDQKAFADLLGYYRDSIYFMLLKMVNNKRDAEDLTIEAFGKAFKNIDQYTPSFAFSTWLFKIASNNCIDFLRRKKASQNHISIDTRPEDNEEFGSESTVTLQADTPDPEENYIIKQKEKVLRTVVKKLHPRYRKLIELRYFKEYSYIEIADVLDIPLGTVKARLYRSRTLLYNILKEREGKI